MSNELPPLPPGGFGALPPPPPPPDGGGFSSMPPPPDGQGAYGYEPPRLGIPWESGEGGWFTRWWQNTKMTLLQPDRFFESMPTAGGHMEPVKFALIGGVAGAVLGTLCQLPFNGLQVFAQLSNNQGGSAETGTVIATIIGGACCGLLLTPVFVAIGLYMMSGLLHVALMILGGAREGFEATLRVVAYTQGAVALPNAIPCINCLSSVYALVLLAMGLHKAHRCEIWQSVVALVLVLVACIGSVLVLYFALIAAFIAAM